MNPVDWNLLVISEAQGRSLSPAQLQKSLFLVGRNLRPQPFYQFINYDYGPFCADVYADSQVLERQGFAEILLPQERSARQYRATMLGLGKAEEIKSWLDPDTVEYVHDLVSWVRSLSFTQLIRAIYEAYPETKENSIFSENQ